MNKAFAWVGPYAGKPGLSGRLDEGHLVVCGATTVKGNFKVLAVLGPAHGMIMKDAAMRGVERYRGAPTRAQVFQSIHGVRIKIQFAAMFAGHFLRRKMRPGPHTREIAKMYVKILHTSSPKCMR